MKQKLTLSFELWKYKKLLSDYFPSANRTLLETPFYTLIDVLKNLKLRLWNSHTVSRQKQEPVVGQSIETSLLGSLASNLLGCSCEGHAFYHSTCSQWYIQPAPAEAQRHTHTTPRFNTLTLSYHLFSASGCLSNTSSQGFHVIFYFLPVSVSPLQMSFLTFVPGCIFSELTRAENGWEKTVEERSSRGGVSRRKKKKGESSWVFFQLIEIDLWGSEIV